MRAYLIECSSNPDYIPTPSEIDELKSEVLCFTMASHLFWTIWSFVNVHQDIEFGYWVNIEYYLTHTKDTNLYLHDISTNYIELWTTESQRIFCCQRSIHES